MNPEWFEGITAEHVVVAGAALGNAVRRWRHHWPNAMFHLFEPLPEWAAHCRERFADDDHVRVMQMPLTDRTGPVEFYPSYCPMTSSLLPFNQDNPSYKPEWRHKEPFWIRGITLDAYCLEYGIDQIGFMELDVQGSELAVLHGAADLLGNGAMGLLLVEVFYTELYQGVPLEPAVTNHLATFGYRAIGKLQNWPTWADVAYRKGGHDGLE